ncbi:toxin glutamine deamidase domain-containing protein [Nocardia testacea]|uniref:toxin glutamine deamidase domain-containing protein n=1 Tax=Nocardia testacea TaxID=248551 RepID=UPI003A88E53F
MSLELPAAFPTWLVDLAAGHFPEGDEDLLRSLAATRNLVATELSELADELSSHHLAEIGAVVQGAAAQGAEETITALAEQAKTLSEFEKSLALQLIDGARNFEYQKLLVIFTGLTLLLQLGWALMFPGGVMVAVQARLAAQQAIRSGLLRVLVRLLVRGSEFAASRPVLVQGGGAGLVQGVIADLGAQQWQRYVTGSREHTDWKSAAVSGFSGLAGGIAGAGAASRVAPGFVRAGWSRGGQILALGGVGGIAGAVAGTFASVAATGGELTAGDLMESLVSGVGGGLIGGAGYAVHRPAVPAVIGLFADAHVSTRTDPISATDVSSPPSLAGAASRVSPPDATVRAPSVAPPSPDVRVGPPVAELPLRMPQERFAASVDARRAVSVPGGPSAGRAGADITDGGSPILGSTPADERTGVPARVEPAGTAAPTPGAGTVEVHGASIREEGGSVPVTDLPEVASAPPRAEVVTDGPISARSKEIAAGYQERAEAEPSVPSSTEPHHRAAVRTPSPESDVRDTAVVTATPAPFHGRPEPADTGVVADAPPVAGQTPNISGKFAEPVSSAAGSVAAADPSPKRNDLRPQPPAGASERPAVVPTVSAPKHTPPPTVREFTDSGEFAPSPDRPVEPSVAEGLPLSEGHSHLSSEAPATGPRETVSLEEFSPIEEWAHQQAVVDALAGPDGEPLVGADPRDNRYGRLINDGGPDQPGRATNCLATVTAAIRSFMGSPNVAPPRHETGALETRLGERGGRQRVEGWAGKRFEDLSGVGGVPEQFAALFEEVANAGPLHSAIVGMSWPEHHPITGETYEGGHAIALVYPRNADGPVFWDPQSGKTWDGPPPEFMATAHRLEAIRLTPEEGFTLAARPTNEPGAGRESAQPPLVQAGMSEPVYAGLPDRGGTADESGATSVPEAVVAPADTTGAADPAVTPDSSGSAGVGGTANTIWGDPHRDAAIAALADEILGDVGPGRLKTFGSLVQLSNLGYADPHTVPGAEDFTGRISKVLGMDTTDPEWRRGVDSMMDAMDVYKRQTEEQWLPLDLVALHDYSSWMDRGWAPPPDSPAAVALADFARSAHLPMTEAAMYERGFTSFTQLARVHLDIADGAPIATEELVDFAYETLYQEAPPAQVDHATVRTLLEVAHAAEVYGLRANSDGWTDYRVMLYETGQLLHLAHEQRERGGTPYNSSRTPAALARAQQSGVEPLAGTRDFSGLPRLAESVHNVRIQLRAGADPENVIGSSDPYDLVMHYRKVRDQLVVENIGAVDGIEGARVTVDQLHTFAPLREVAGFGEGFDPSRYNSRDYADRNYGYDPTSGYAVPGQWIPRRLGPMIVPEDLSLARSFFDTAKEMGLEPGSAGLRTGIVHGAGVNAYPDMWLRRMGIERPEVAVFHLNDNEVKYRSVLHGEDARGDAYLKYVDGRGVPHRYPVKEIWKKWGPAIDEQARQVFPAADPSAGLTTNAIDRPVALEVGNIFDHVRDLAYQADPSGRLYHELRGDGSGTRVDGVDIPRADAQVSRDVALAMFVLDSAFGDAPDAIQLEVAGLAPAQRWDLMKSVWFGETGRIHELTGQWGLTEVQRLAGTDIEPVRNALMRWGSVDGLINSAGKLAGEGLAINDGGGWATGDDSPLMVNTHFNEEAFLRYAAAHPRVAGLNLDIYSSEVNFSDTDSGLGFAGYMLLPPGEEKGPGTPVVVREEPPAEGGTRTRVRWASPPEEGGTSDGHSPESGGPDDDTTDNPAGQPSGRGTARPTPWTPM